MPETEDLAIRVLTPEQIREMNRQGSPLGPKLEEDGFYFLAFLMNDKQNRAMEPRPFKVPTRYLDPIAETGIGMPFIVGPDPMHHVYAASGQPDDIVKLSRRYAWGEIVRTIRNKATNNVWALVKAFKEYVPKIERGEMPRYTSPMIAPDNIMEALKTGIINGGRVLHLQAVGAPGYDPKIAQIKGHVCSGMLGKCMEELRTFAAAGTLEAWRNDPANNSLFALSQEEQAEPNMAEKKGNEADSSAPITAGQLDERLEAFKGELLESIKTTFGASGAAAALETEKTKGATGQENAAQEKGPLAQMKGKEGADSKGKTAAQPADGAIDIEKHPAFADLKKKVDEAEAKAKKEAEERSKLARHTLAEKIARLEVFLRKTPRNKVDDRTKALEAMDEAALKVKFETLAELRANAFGASGADPLDDEPVILAVGASGDGGASIDYAEEFATSAGGLTY